MALVVTKFGGTSVGSTDRIRAVHAPGGAQQAGDSVVAVVSGDGQGHRRARRAGRAITAEPPDREMEHAASTGEQVSISLLAMASSPRGRTPCRSPASGGHRHRHRAQQAKITESVRIACAKRLSRARS